MGLAFHCVVVLAAICAVFSIRHTAHNSVVEPETTARLFYPSSRDNENKEYLKPTVQHKTTHKPPFHSSQKHEGYEESHTHPPTPRSPSYSPTKHKGYDESQKTTDHTTAPISPFYLSAKHNGYSKSQTLNAHIPTPLSPLYSFAKYYGYKESNNSNVYTPSLLIPFLPSGMHNEYSESHVHTSSTPKPVSYPCYRYCCNCKKDKAECLGRGRNMTYLPRVPARTRHFRMWEAKLPLLTRSVLANLSNFNIETMDLSRNEIRYVEKDVFSDFVHLRVLRLGGNYISVSNLREAFWSLSEKLEKVCLDKMEIPDLPEDFFAAFRNRSFSSVDLQSNKLTIFDSAVFAVFRRVEKLDVSDNKIGALKLLKQAHINRIWLEWSDLKKAPDFCLQSHDKDQKNKSVNAFIRLLFVHLANGWFNRLPPFRGQCLPDLVKLELGRARKLTTLENNFIADLPKLQVLMIFDMNELWDYKPYCLNSTSLKEVHFSNNKRIKHMRSRNMDIFRYCPNLELLTIQQMGVELKLPEFRLMLLRLKYLRELKLKNIRMASIPTDFLWRFPRLKKLEFTGNGLTSSGLGRALTKVNSLEFLIVQGNSITVVNENTLPWEFRQNVKEIDLSQNPFTCTCDLLWFRKWLDDVTHNKSITVTSFNYRKGSRSQYQCITPEDMKYVPLQLFNPTEESCAIKNPYIVIGVATGCFVVMVTVTTALCYRYRWHLRYYVYRLRRRTRYRQMGNRPLGGRYHFDIAHKGFEGHQEGGGEVIRMSKYDVYLAHSAQDADWIVHELLPLLEEEHGLQVFLEERNAIGGSVGENIARYMDESARVMLVVSDNYNREGWRQYEFEHILYATFEQHKDIIVLLLGDVEAGRMTQDMRRMLTRGTFLQWGPGEDAKRHFRNGLKVALRTQDLGFQNMC